MASGFAWGDRLPRVPGRRVDLRWLTRSDAPALLEVFGDPEVTRYWSSPPLAGLAAAEGLVAEIHDLFAARQLFQWGVGRREDDAVIGTCTLLGIDRTHRRAEIGFALGRAAWGRGLGREAVGLLLGFAYDTLGLYRLEADVDPDNERCLRLLDRHGFRREGRLRQRWRHGGEARDSVVLGLLRPEWTRGGGDRLPG